MVADNTLGLETSTLAQVAPRLFHSHVHRHRNTLALNRPSALLLTQPELFVRQNFYSLVLHQKLAVAGEITRG